MQLGKQRATGVKGRQWHKDRNPGVCPPFSQTSSGESSLCGVVGLFPAMKRGIFLSAAGHSPQRRWRESVREKTREDVGEVREEECKW